MLMRFRGENPDEIAGFVDAMRGRAAGRGFGC
ncbi:MAG: anthranilate phosphoribosyltransferase [Paracoccaceae bacterium]|jgi:anthranilate phosphoribosyltransferase